MNRFHLSRRALGTLALAPVAARAQTGAADFPRQPIRLVVPFPAGGTTDLLARLFGQRMGETLGQPVVVENRGGAGGSIGADVVAKAPPDGHVLLFHNITFPTTTAAMALAGRAPHDLERDFAPVSLAANVPFLLLGHPGLGARDLAEFVTVARNRTDGLFYGSTGPGSYMNMIGESLRRLAGIKLDHIPFRGAAPLVQELLAGRVQFGGDQISTSLGHVRRGGLVGLAVGGAQRTAALSNVPTVREQGFPDLEFEGWNGLFAPARTPPAVLAKLGAAVAEAAQHPEIRRRCVDVAADPVGSDAATFTAQVREQYARLTQLIAAAGLRPE